MDTDLGPMANPEEKSLFERVSEVYAEKYAAGELGNAPEGRIGEEHHATEDAQPGEVHPLEIEPISEE